MKTFAEYCAEKRAQAIDEGVFDKVFQKAMEKLAVLIGPERMAKLEALLKKYDGKKIDKKELKNDLESEFKTFKLDGEVAKEI